MKERPVLFSGPMVRAILEGRKTQTRRIFKLPKGLEWYDSLGGEQKGWFTDGKGWWHVDEIECPHGTVGDRLWVREAWASLSVGNQTDYLYRADTHKGLEKRDGDQKWKPSRHMPRTACRLILEITGVRVERLQEISNADCVAEGIEPIGEERLTGKVMSQAGRLGDNYSTVRQLYSSFWQSINGPDSWAQNPWVWVIEFKRINNP